MTMTPLNNFIHKKGRQFHAAPLPDDIMRGKVGDCFDWCLAVALHSDGKYKYCEGVAKVMRPGSKWIHHAWLTDETETYAYDPTWKAKKGELILPVPAFYIGAMCDLHSVMEFVSKTNFKSPFANWDKDPERAQKVYDLAH